MDADHGIGMLGFLFAACSFVFTSFVSRTLRCCRYPLLPDGPAGAFEVRDRVRPVTQAALKLTPGRVHAGKWLPVRGISRR